MSYLIATTHDNGYRCSCCRQSWEASTRWTDDLDEALAEVPAEKPEPSEFMDLESVEVTDGSTGETIAKATVGWPTGGGRGAPYSYTRWSGYTPEGSFETIFKGEHGEIVTDRTWGEILDDVRKKKADQDRQKAQAELEAAQEKIRRLGVGTP